MRISSFFLCQVQQERDDLYNKFVSAIHEVQQKAGFKNLLLEKKLLALADVLEKKEAQLNEVQIPPDQLHVIICIISRDFIFSKIFRIVKRFLFGSMFSPSFPICGYFPNRALCDM